MRNLVSMNPSKICARGVKKLWNNEKLTENVSFLGFFWQLKKIVLIYLFRLNADESLNHDFFWTGKRIFSR